MTVDQAFTQALEYETRIRDQYLEAAADAIVPEARTFFEIGRASCRERVFITV